MRRRRRAKVSAERRWPAMHHPRLLPSPGLQQGQQGRGSNLPPGTLPACLRTFRDLQVLCCKPRLLIIPLTRQLLLPLPRPPARLARQQRRRLQLRHGADLASDDALVAVQLREAQHGLALDRLAQHRQAHAPLLRRVQLWEGRAVAAQRRQRRRWCGGRRRRHCRRRRRRFLSRRERGGWRQRWHDWRSRGGGCSGRRRRSGSTPLLLLVKVVVFRLCLGPACSAAVTMPIWRCCSAAAAAAAAAAPSASSISSTSSAKSCASAAGCTAAAATAAALSAGRSSSCSSSCSSLAGRSGGSAVAAAAAAVAVQLVVAPAMARSPSPRASCCVEPQGSPPASTALACKSSPPPCTRTRPSR